MSMTHSDCEYDSKIGLRNCIIHTANHVSLETSSCTDFRSKFVYGSSSSLRRFSLNYEQSVSCKSTSKTMAKQQKKTTTLLSPRVPTTKLTTVPVLEAS